MKERKVEKVISGILVGILIILTIFMIADVKKLQGNARVVNYAGIIRGATQRMIKLEVVDEGNDELIQYLDDIFSGLMHGGGKYNLLIISALVLSILALVYFSVFSRNWWQIFLLAIPAELIIIFCFHIKKPHKQ